MGVVHPKGLVMAKWPDKAPNEQSASNSIGSRFICVSSGSNSFAKVEVGVGEEIMFYEIGGSPTQSDWCLCQYGHHSGVETPEDVGFAVPRASGILSRLRLSSRSVAVLIGGQPLVRQNARTNPGSGGVHVRTRGRVFLSVLFLELKVAFHREFPPHPLPVGWNPASYSEVGGR